MALPSLPGLPSSGLPELPDLATATDEVQNGIDEIEIPKPPSLVQTGQFFLDTINNMAEKLGMPKPFPLPLPNPPSPPAGPPGLPKVPGLPAISKPFKLPFGV